MYWSPTFYFNVIYNSQYIWNKSVSTMTSIIHLVLAGNEQTANFYLKIQESKMQNLDFYFFDGIQKNAASRPKNSS